MPRHTRCVLSQKRTIVIITVLFWAYRRVRLWPGYIDVLCCWEKHQQLELPTRCTIVHTHTTFTQIKKSSTREQRGRVRALLQASSGLLVKSIATPERERKGSWQTLGLILSSLDFLFLSLCVYVYVSQIQ